MSSQPPSLDLLSEADVPETLPLVAIRSGVLFPGGVVPLSIGPKGTRAIEAATDGLIVVATTRDPNVEDPGPAEVFEVGVVARVVKFDRTPAGCEVVVHALARCLIEPLEGLEPHLRAEVTLLDTEDEDLDELEVEKFRSVALRIVHRQPELPPQAHDFVRDIQIPTHLVDLVIANLVASTADKQRLLETLSAKVRMALALELLAPMLEALPARPVDEGECKPHQMPAVDTCLRCGAFVCDACRGVGGASELCRACRNRPAPANPHLQLARRLGWASLVVAALVIVKGAWALRVLAPGGFLMLGTALTGLGLAIGAVKLAPTDPAHGYLRPATLGLGLNALLSLLWIFEVSRRVID